MTAPVGLFTYNRLRETQQAIAALQRNYLAPETDLYLFSDGPKNNTEQKRVDELRAFLKTTSGFKTINIIESTKNKGLANSIITGVSIILEKHEKVIILEDDLITKPNFLNFMNQALDFYDDEPWIQSISGYSLAVNHENKDIYFQLRPGSWGWATWKNRWNSAIFNKEELFTLIHESPSILRQFKQDCGADISKMLVHSLQGKNDSWYVRWVFNHFVTKRYSVYPTYSLVENIGFGIEGTHCKNINCYVSNPANPEKISYNLPTFKQPKKKLNKEFLNYFTRTFKIWFRIKLVGKRSGRKQLKEEFFSRIGLIHKSKRS